MPNLSEHKSLDVVRLLSIGESGTGKTGAIASLVIAGYHVHILDYDNGLDILVAALREHYKDDPAGLQAAFARVQYETLRDEILFATAYKRAGEVLKSWEPDKWDVGHILVIDTLTTFSEAAFRHALSLSGRLNQRPQLQDYGWVADSVKLFIEMVTADTAKYNLIVNTHVRYFSGDEDNQTQARGLPNAIGQQIPTTVSRYFNSVVLFKTQGSGVAAKRVISTQPQGVIEVKCSNPFGVKKQYGIESGMADLFQDILGRKPNG
jgi:hypothetical protein